MSAFIGLLTSHWPHLAAHVQTAAQSLSPDQYRNIYLCCPKPCNLIKLQTFAVRAIHSNSRIRKKLCGKGGPLFETGKLHERKQQIGGGGGGGGGGGVPLAGREREKNNLKN